MKEQEEMESGAVVSQGPVMWGLSGEGFAFYSEQEEAMEDSWARRWQDTLFILGKKKKKKNPSGCFVEDGIKEAIVLFE